MNSHLCEIGGGTVCTNMAKLKCGMTQEEVAERLGVDSSTFSRKMKADGLSFTVEQMHKLVEILNMTPQEAIQIFLQ